MDKIYRQCNIRMSKNKMADLLYAIIMCSAKVTSTFTLGKSFTRAQNAFTGADLMIELEEKDIPKFEEMSGVTLVVPQKAHIN